MEETNELLNKILLELERLNMEFLLFKVEIGNELIEIEDKLNSIENTIVINS